MAERFDAVVIGTGQAGPALCARLDREGLKTALIERKLLGGTCVNNGCIPTKTLVIIGGSYIGLEFAQMYRRFGAGVTVVEKLPRLIAREDEDVSEEIRAILEREGIAVRTGAECMTVSRRNGGIAVGLECQEGAP